eukprot:4797074-Prymnesium_polylepis.2
MHAAVLVEMRRDRDKDVQKAALETLGKLAPDVLPTYAPALAAKLKGTHPGVCSAAVKALGNLATKDLAPHAAAVAAMLKDKDEDVRKAALEALGKLASEDLAPHAAAVVALLTDKDRHVRKAALEALGKLVPEDVATYASTLEAMLKDEDEDVRKAAAEALAKAPYAAASKELAEKKGVHKAAIASVGSSLKNITANVGAVLSLGKLEDSDKGVHKAAAAAIASIGGSLKNITANVGAVLKKGASQEAADDSGEAALQASKAVERIAACEAQFDISNEGLTVENRLQELEDLTCVPHNHLKKMTDRIAEIEEAVGIS